MGGLFTPTLLNWRAPNKRLKLSAPVLNGSGCRLDLRGGGFSFVFIHTRRRSLSAIR